MDNELEMLQHLKFNLEFLQKKYDNTLENLCRLEETVNTYNKMLDNLTIHKQYYKNAIDIIYERSIKELKDVLNSALLFIFQDRNFEVDVELSDKRGKSLTFIVLHNGKKVSLKKGMGMGVKCVISAILHMYYLQCKNSKILMLDEAYSNISEEYLPRFFEFLKKLSDSLHFKIIIITHDKRFLDYADKSYRIDNGQISCIYGK